MVEGMVQGCTPGQSGQQNVMFGGKQHAGADAEQNDSHVFEAGIGQQPLDVIFHHGVHDAQKRRQNSQPHDQPTPPGRTDPQEVKIEAAQSIDRRLQHYARQQGRNMAGCGGMSFGQPDVQGNHAGFRPKPDQCEQKHQISRRLRQQFPPEQLKAKTAGCPRENKKGADDERGADMGHDDVNETGTHTRGVLMLI